MDATVRVWDVRTGTARHVLSGHTKGVWDLAFAPDGRTLATVSQDATIRLWDPETGALRRVLGGHAQTIYDVCFSPDGRTGGSSAPRHPAVGRRARRGAPGAPSPPRCAA
jgi:WD40 repeat protein